jgi:hypothetical protein
MPIISRLNNHSCDFVNNEIFKVVEIDDNDITISNECKILTLPISLFKRSFLLAFCITIHKSQGQTYDTHYNIYEWNRLNKKLKYVAITRAKDINYINII